MSREIKFRIWNPEENQFMESGGTPTMLSNFFLRSAKMHTYHRMEYQQFTGLHDKNGKPIFEGDICRVSIKGLGVTVVSEMKYFQDFGMFAFSSVPHYYVRKSENIPMGSSGSSTPWKPYLPSSYKSIEIIGNSKQNPELLP